MSKESMIVFEKVSKGYKDIKALDEVSFSIEEQDIFGYIGPNGAGKTTTIKILVGLIKQYEGKVYVKGRDIAKDGEMHKFLGYLPQEVGFQEWRTVTHALQTFGRLSGVPVAELPTRIKGALELVGLADVEQKKITYLSGGMKQKLHLAQALIHDPELLVLDEPMTGLDPTSRYQIKKVIKSLRAQGKTILFSSHILSDVQDISTRIAILNRGKVLKVGSPGQLQREFKVGNDIELGVEENSGWSGGMDKLGGLAGVGSVTQPKSDTFLIKLKANVDLDGAIQEILQFLLESKARIRNFNLLKPSLEEVYLKYVSGERQK